MDALAHDAEEAPDAFQHERAERSGCSQRGICDALKRLKITRKKHFEDARRLFKKQADIYELMKIPVIYIDESGFSEDMPRLFGYAPNGARCLGMHDWQAKHRTYAAGGQALNCGFVRQQHQS